LPVTLLVDAKKLLVVFLRAHIDVAALVDDRVWTKLDPDARASSFPAVVLNRIGGTPAPTPPLWLDRARIQVDAWAGTLEEDPEAEHTAWTLAATVRGTLEGLVGSHAAGVVSKLEDDLGPTDDQDPETRRLRVRFGIIVYTHPTPS
jgi:uncharacterized protein DUF3168